MDFASVKIQAWMVPQEHPQQNSPTPTQGRSRRNNGTATTAAPMRATAGLEWSEPRLTFGHYLYFSGSAPTTGIRSGHSECCIAIGGGPCQTCRTDGTVMASSAFALR